MAIAIVLILIGSLFALAYFICGVFDLTFPSISKPYQHKGYNSRIQVVTEEKKKEETDKAYILDIPEWKIRKIVEILNNEKKE